MLDPPSPDVGVTHVAVGVNVVWALTKDNKVSQMFPPPPSGMLLGVGDGSESTFLNSVALGVDVCDDCRVRKS